MHPTPNTDRPGVKRFVAAVAAAAALILSNCGGSTPSASPDKAPTQSPSTAAPTPTTEPTTPAPTPTTEPATPAPTPTTEPATPAPTPVQPAVRSYQWGDPTRTVDLGGGFLLAACEGQAPLLCVWSGDRAIGLVEAARFATSSLDSWDAGADDDTNLRLLAADFATVMIEDRSAGCPDGYQVTPHEVTEFRLAGVPAVAFGFTGDNADGSASELNLQYATVDGDDVVLLTAAAYDEGGCPGRDDQSSFDSTTLARVRSPLETALRAGPLPPRAT